MAKRQTRRSVSLRRSLHAAALRAAASRGQTLSVFVESALADAGVPVVPHVLQPLSLVQAHPSRAAARVADRRNGAERGHLPPCRTVSLNRSVYDAAKQVATGRGLSLAAFVQAALADAGVISAPAREADRHTSSRESQQLGDDVASPLGFR